MEKTDFKSVDNYIAAQPQPVQDVLGRVRSIIRKAMPDAEEMISYKIPAYRLHGSPALYFAAWKQHYSLYPASDQLIAAFKNELAGSIHKHTIRFPFGRPVPVRLIERIAKFRAKECLARAKTKTGAPTKR